MNKRIGLWGALAVALLLAAATGAMALGRPAQGLLPGNAPAQGAGLNAGAPLYFNYQGLLLDPATGRPVPDGNYTLDLAIYDVDTGGTALWTETQTVAVQKGLFDVRLGTVTPLDPTWVDGRDLWLGIAVQGDTEMLPRTQLVSVPYAINAGDVRGADIHPDNVYVEPYGLVIDMDGYWHGQPISGTAGATGPTGPEGATGPQGLQGPQGITGTTGATGPEGATGPQGLQGPQGITGTTGATGPEGATGPQGPAGPSGPSGPTGPTGPSDLCGYTQSCGGNGVSLTNGLDFSFRGRGGTYGVIGLGTNAGVMGDGSLGPVGVLGNKPGVSAGSSGVLGINNAASGIVGPQGATQAGVWGDVTGGVAGAMGLFGTVNVPGINSGDAGVMGICEATTGIWGYRNGSNQIGATDYGVWGDNASGTAESAGVFGTVLAPGLSAAGVWGINNGPVSPARLIAYPSIPAPIESSGLNAQPADYGVRGMTNSPVPGSAGVLGEATGTGVVGVYGRNPTTGGYAGFFDGNVYVHGTLSKRSGTFVIDHPLDPANKTLTHSFVESPDMMNVYNGNVVLDKAGTAWVELPTYFEALNKDYRYQLTTIGGYAPVYVAQEIAGNRFQIAGGTPGLTVSWQVTGVRNDPWAQMNPIVVEQEKPAAERGSYDYPELYDYLNDAGR
jgi:hypothetical protein